MAPPGAAVWRGRAEDFDLDTVTGSGAGHVRGCQSWAADVPGRARRRGGVALEAPGRHHQATHGRVGAHLGANAAAASAAARSCPGRRGTPRLRSGPPPCSRGCRWPGARRGGRAGGVAKPAWLTNPVRASAQGWPTERPGLADRALPGVGGGHQAGARSSHREPAARTGHGETGTTRAPPGKGVIVPGQAALHRVVTRSIPGAG